MGEKNPWDTLGNQFVNQYYQLFDNKDTRRDIGALYHPADSLLTFEGAQHRGNEEIVKKFTSIPLDYIIRKPTTIDCQPTAEGGVLISVLGQLKNSAENDKVMGFSQTFLLRPFNNTYYVYHDIFRLVLHDFSA